MEVFRRKKRAEAGFSMAETLVALIIILLVSSIIAAGMPAAQKAFYNVRESANAQMLLSTTLTELRNELTTASNIQNKDGVLTYINPVNGDSSLKFDAGKSCFWLTAYQDVNTTGVIGRPLVSNAARTDTLSLVVEGDPFVYQAGDPYITVKGFTVRSALTGDADLASVGDYKIPILVP